MNEDTAGLDDTTDAEKAGAAEDPKGLHLLIVSQGSAEDNPISSRCLQESGSNDREQEGMLMSLGPTSNCDLTDR